ncbi:MAG: phosphatidylserine decarboxylase, partial [Sporomusaceae bacterium]|nr:phosphatidylserine decarboxylase [Sporomusaceae bacterium]
IIRVFLSVFNVHLQRSPVEGTVKSVEYKKGKFLKAMDEKAHIENEQNIITVENNKGETFIVKQIAGILARRVVSWVKANDKVERYSEKHSEQNISDKVYEILQKKTEKLKGTHFTFQKNGAIQTEFTDLILIVKAKDLGWFHSYYPAGQKAQNVLVSSTSREVIVNGKKQTLTDEKYERRMVPYPAGYNSRDSAAGEFELVDAKTGKVVWRFTDTRDRSGYDETGPESMFGRIVSTAYDKMKDRVKMK